MPKRFPNPLQPVPNAELGLLVAFEISESSAVPPMFTGSEKFLTASRNLPDGVSGALRQRSSLSIRVCSCPARCARRSAFLLSATAAVGIGGSIIAAVPELGVNDWAERFFAASLDRKAAAISAICIAQRRPALRRTGRGLSFSNISSWSAAAILLSYARTAVVLQDDRRLAAGCTEARPLSGLCSSGTNGGFHPSRSPSLFPRCDRWLSSRSPRLSKSRSLPSRLRLSPCWSQPSPPPRLRSC